MQPGRFCNYIHKERKPSCFSTMYSSSLRNLSEVRCFLSRHLTEANCEWAFIEQVQLMVNEAFSNIVRHSYRGYENQPVGLEIQISDRGVTCILSHTGIEFVPGKKVFAVQEKPSEGGYGLFLIHELADMVNYECNEDGWNTVTMFKSFTAGGTL